MTKKILVDLTHPAHLHFFRPAMRIWRQRGHQIIIVARDKDITLQLLKEYGISYTCLSKARKGVLGLVRELIEHESKLMKMIRKIRPDVLLEVAGTFIVHAGFLTRTPSLVFYDTENATLSNAITYPFATKVITPAYYKGDIGKKHIRYNGYQELAYTHPNYFTPNLTILKELGLNKSDKLFVVRFVSWEAGHDVLRKGISLQGKRRIIKSLSQYGRVIITSEGKLPRDLEKYNLRISPTKIHDVLAASTLYVGESATMASEAAILGIPFIFLSPVSLGNTGEEEHEYKLGFNLLPSEEDLAIELALDLINRPNLRRDWQRKRRKLLDEKIDVTAWMVDFVENLHTR
jgi:uncharacterized protein